MAEDNRQRFLYCFHFLGYFEIGGKFRNKPAFTDLERTGIIANYMKCPEHEAGPLNIFRHAGVKLPDEPGNTWDVCPHIIGIPCFRTKEGGDHNAIFRVEQLRREASAMCRLRRHCLAGAKYMMKRIIRAETNHILARIV